MKKYLNRALLFKDFKYAKWLGLLLFGEILLLKTFVIISQIRHARLLNIKHIPYSDIFQGFKWTLAMSEGSKTAYMIITVVLLSVILMWHERSNSSYQLTASMPFRRGEIMAGKLLTGNFIILSAFIVDFILMCIIYASNLDIMRGNILFSDLPKWFLINTLTYMAAFSFLMFVQSVMGSSMISGVAGVILVAIPKTLFTAIASILRSHGLRTLSSHIRDIGERLYLFSYNDGSLASNSGSTEYLYYMNYWQKIVVLAAVIILFSILAAKFYKHNRLEMTGSLVMFKPLEVVFKIGFAVCFAIPFAFVFNSTIYMELPRELFMDLLIALGIAIGYFISGKIVKAASKAAAR